jgi:hypothetical protein
MRSKLIIITIIREDGGPGKEGTSLLLLLNILL